MAGVVAVCALGSRKLAGSPVSAAMVFADCGVPIGPVVVEDAAVHNAIAVQLKDGFRRIRIAKRLAK
ncbi:hypothetical protein [Streptomyces sp. NBC_01207]|uniref:hypothetical protein n=1 Tax=Streptomyces sp. NBC_01207 TaxID=2903772 RepID=UPI002E100164|nr:hypothetical protein OG457_00350 [Streptomyces sp. NBC_01207]